MRTIVRAVLFRAVPIGFWGNHNLSMSQSMAVDFELDRYTGHVEVQENSQNNPPKILVIDDEPMLRSAYRRMLRPRFEVYVADSGASALQRIEEFPDFDVVICDFQMPDMNGKKVYESICKIAAASADRVLFCTGGAIDSYSSNFLQSIGNLVLEKPCTCQQLLSAVDSVIQRSRKFHSDPTRLADTGL